MKEMLEFFAENGYVVVRDALTEEEVAEVNDGIAADRAARPEFWEPSPTASGHLSVGCDAPELLHRTGALDRLTCHPSIAPLARSILGPGAAMSGLTFLRREPCDVQPPDDLDGGDPLCLTRVWHREDSGNVEGAQRNEYFVPALQVIFYMEDVDAGSHCFSIIPESVETKRNLPKTHTGSSGWGARDRLRIDDGDVGYVDPERPVWVDAFGRELTRRTGRVDIYGSGGTAIIFNNSSYHCGSVRHTRRPRHTVHVRYRQPEPVASKHALKPPWESVAQFSAALPSRPTIGRL